MAIGVVTTLASGAAEQVMLPAGNFPWPTIRVLNPNDGVAYIKINMPVTGSGTGAWDYKVPSQSFALLPGEGQGWRSAGLYYLDQSGSGMPGEVSIYLSYQETKEPIFQAIGRATIALTTTMDLVTGSQPANPAPGTVRLWADPTSRVLQELTSDGTTKTFLDSTNYFQYSLGGDLSGTIGNARITVQQGDAIQFPDSRHRIISGLPNDNTMYLDDAGGFTFRWSSPDGYATMMILAAPGNLSLPAGGLKVGGTGQFSSLLVDGSVAAQGPIYIGGPVGVNSNISFDGTYLKTGSDFLVTGELGTTGDIYTNGWSASWPNNLGGWGVISQGVINSTKQVTAYNAYDGENQSAFLAPNDPSLPCLAFSWDTWSSVDHAMQLGLRFELINDPLSIVRSINGFSYDHVTPAEQEDGSRVGVPNYGFSPNEVQKILPELVRTSGSIDMTRMIVILWEAVKALDRKVLIAEPHPL